MPDTGRGPSDNAARESPAGGLDGFIDQIANYWKVSTRSSRQLLSGDYSLGDAAQDLNTLITSATGYAVRVADDLWGPEPPLAAYDGTWEATMNVFDHVTQRPLTLRTSGLRAVGAPDIRIPPSNIAFDPPEVRTGESEFRVTVTMGPGHRDRTFIFVGEVVSDETRAPVTDRVRANNRDDGPVR
ncbi:MAG: hypothetical protein M3163_14760 [Actinomycetota bacterium]|nr:hypothetical protein [Actinomycetota bacterium]